MAGFDLRLGDAMRLLASLPDGAVDAAITDPPYGTTANEWDVAPDWGALMAELLRVTRGPVVVFSQMPVAVDVVQAARKAFRYQWVLRKSRPTGFLDANRRPLRAHELALVFCEGGYGTYRPQAEPGRPYERFASGRVRTTNYGSYGPHDVRNGGGRCPSDVQEMASITYAAHPTEKPVATLRYLVRTYTEPGQSVLDPYAGSGSLGEACALEGRSFVGCELDEGYWRKACERVRMAYAQGRLFEIGDGNG